MSSAVMMLGLATATMVESTRIMNKPTIIAQSAFHGLVDGPGRERAGWARVSGSPGRVRLIGATSVISSPWAALPRATLRTESFPDNAGRMIEQVDDRRSVSLKTPDRNRSEERRV